MAADQLFKKRKQRERNLARRKASRVQKENILILCEGEKTEPAYFTSFREYLRLPAIRVRIDRKNYGLDPLGLVKAAEKAFQNDPELDQIYCVFDKDQHTTWDAAHERINVLVSRKRAIPVQAITSIPCFELWFLLHFTSTAKPYTYVGEHSACACLILDLKRYIPDYEKSAANMFEQCKENLEPAIKRSEKLQEEHRKTGTSNPSTRMHLLVKKLQLMACE